MIDDEKEEFWCYMCSKQVARKHWDLGHQLKCPSSAPQEKQLTYMQDHQSIDRRMQKVIEQKTQPTSETYDQGAYIIVQAGDDEAFKNGNYYTAHLYFNSVQEWEIKEEYNTYLIR